MGDLKHILIICSQDSSIFRKASPRAYPSPPGSEAAGRTQSSGCFYQFTFWYPSRRGCGKDLAVRAFSPSYSVVVLTQALRWYQMKFLASVYHKFKIWNALSVSTPCGLMTLFSIAFVIKHWSWNWEWSSLLWKQATQEASQQPRWYRP